MKKILFCTDSLIMGGQEKISIDYLKMLNETKKYNISLLINEDNGEEENFFIDQIPKEIKYKFVIDKEIIRRINLYRELKKKNIIYKLFYNYYLEKRKKSYNKNIKKLIKEEKYDYLIDFTCQLPLELCDNKVFSWAHVSLNKFKNKKTLEKKINKINQLIVLNQDMKEEGKKLFKNIQEDKFKVLYNFFDIDEILKLADSDLDLNIKEKELIQDNYLFACCRLDKQKDIDTLVEAYKILKEKYSIKEKLYIAGNGDQKERLENLVKKYNLEKEIIFLGKQKNPYIWMKKAKLFIHSSNYEGFGMVLVEALITNGMVISSDCPVGPREILENGKSGILFPVGNKEKLVEEILKILNNKEIIEKYKIESKRRIKDFSKEKIKEKVQEILK
ncbi:glycosyltransferase [Fusobacterium sp.]|uniref:glycosyltransferase n=1 Tax=Fusobacterium sp. TaxID=68766 RepID=UPI00261A63C9|nr:glycosyltransferase [Fusobacterium sp.]